MCTPHAVNMAAVVTFHDSQRMRALNYGYIIAVLAAVARPCRSVLAADASYDGFESTFQFYHLLLFQDPNLLCYLRGGPLACCGTMMNEQGVEDAVEQRHGNTCSARWKRGRLLVRALQHGGENVFDAQHEYVL